MVDVHHQGKHHRAQHIIVKPIQFQRGEVTIGIEHGRLIKNFAKHAIGAIHHVQLKRQIADALVIIALFGNGVQFIPNVIDVGLILMGTVSVHDGFANSPKLKVFQITVGRGHRRNQRRDVIDGQRQRVFLAFLIASAFFFQTGEMAKGVEPNVFGIHIRATEKLRDLFVAVPFINDPDSTATFEHTFGDVLHGKGFARARARRHRPVVVVTATGKQVHEIHLISCGGQQQPRA